MAVISLRLETKCSETLSFACYGPPPLPPPSSRHNKVTVRSLDSVSNREKKHTPFSATTTPLSLQKKKKQHLTTSILQAQSFSFLLCLRQTGEPKYQSIFVSMQKGPLWEGVITQKCIKGQTNLIGLDIIQCACVFIYLSIRK